jgi:hypothetical protein
LSWVALHGHHKHDHRHFVAARSVCAWADSCQWA